MRGRKSNSFGDRLLMALVGLFLYAPIIILIVFSFNAGNSSSVWKGFSLHWYAELLNDRLIMHSVYTTLMVSLLATIIATIAGTFAAIGFFGMRRRARTGLLAVNNIPMMNADIVTGVSLMPLASRPRVVPVQGATTSTSNNPFGPTGSTSVSVSNGSRPVISRNRFLKSSARPKRVSNPAALKDMMGVISAPAS